MAQVKNLIVNGVARVVNKIVAPLIDGAEVATDIGSSGTIDLANGSIQKTTASSISLPTVVAGRTITVITTASSVSWSGGSRVWSGGSAPTLRSGSYQLFTFVGFGSYWFGVYGGPFS